MPRICNEIYGSEVSEVDLGILDQVTSRGPMTVPQIGRRLLYSRQSIQTHVDRLVEVGLFELADNPDHRQSKLVRPTDEGKKLGTKWMARIQEVTGLLSRQFNLDDLNHALKTLRDVTEHLENDDWNKAIANMKPLDDRL